MLAPDHFLDETELGMRDWRSERTWVKRPKEAPDLLENKGIYRAKVRAES